MGYNCRSFQMLYEYQRLTEVDILTTMECTLNKYGSAIMKLAGITLQEETGKNEPQLKLEIVKWSEFHVRNTGRFRIFKTISNKYIYLQKQITLTSCLGLKF